MLYLIAILLVSGIIFYWISTLQGRSSGLPPGRLIYSDHKEWGKVETPLYDPTYNLTGKPDFIVDTKKGLIPIEVKSGRARSKPYDSHIYQLAAYCLLIDQTYGIRPEYGILHYSNQDIAVDYTPELEHSVIELIREIRSLGKQRSVDRSHQSKNRCLNCGFSAICDQALG
jgi:CRISPR-associated exonuclease Cas4